MVIGKALIQIKDQDKNEKISLTATAKPYPIPDPAHNKSALATVPVPVIHRFIVSSAITATIFMTLAEAEEMEKGRCESVRVGAGQEAGILITRHQAGKKTGNSP